MPETTRAAATMWASTSAWPPTRIWATAGVSPLGRVRWWAGKGVSWSEAAQSEKLRQRQQRQQLQQLQQRQLQLQLQPDSLHWPPLAPTPCRASLRLCTGADAGAAPDKTTRWQHSGNTLTVFWQRSGSALAAALAHAVSGASSTLLCLLALLGAFYFRRRAWLATAPSFSRARSAGVAFPCKSAQVYF